MGRRPGIVTQTKRAIAKILVWLFIFTIILIGIASLFNNSKPTVVETSPVATTHKKLMRKKKIIPKVITREDSMRAADHAAAKSIIDGLYGSGESGPHCVKGYRCGNACISMNKHCHK